jgi:hypothetical protein
MITVKKSLLIVISLAVLVLLGLVIPTSALAAADESVLISPPPSGTTGELPFTDVTEASWCYPGVKYVYENGLMEGVSATTFAPTATLTRAMLVTIVYRLDGKPAVTAANPFTDVAAGMYYTDAVTWAAENHVVNGYDASRFGPDDPVTRQQLATILYRYAQLKGYDVSVGLDTNILSYEDAFFISEYAIPAIQWACGASVMQGDGVRLSPAGHATRAQAATMLQRFAENVAK